MISVKGLDSLSENTDLKKDVENSVNGFLETIHNKKLFQHLIDKNVLDDSGKFSLNENITVLSDRTQLLDILEDKKIKWIPVSAWPGMGKGFVVDTIKEFFEREGIEDVVLDHWLHVYMADERYFPKAMKEFLFKNRNSFTTGDPETFWRTYIYYTFAQDYINLIESARSQNKRIIEFPTVIYDRSSSKKGLRRKTKIMKTPKEGIPLTVDGVGAHSQLTYTLDTLKVFPFVDILKGFKNVLNRDNTNNKDLSIRTSFRIEEYLLLLEKLLTELKSSDVVVYDKNFNDFVIDKKFRDANISQKVVQALDNYQIREKEGLVLFHETGEKFKEAVLKNIS